jgi:hypothetical protein
VNPTQTNATDTDTDPAAQTGHPAWCTIKHQVDEPHESQAFTVTAVGQTQVALIEQPPGEDPRILLETVTGKGAPYGNTFTFAQAQELTDALLALWCIGGACDCNGDPLCPGSPDYVEGGQAR